MRRHPWAASGATRSIAAAEPLESRALLAVTAVLAGGDLAIDYNAAGDLTADITSDGTNYTVSGTGLAPTKFAIGVGGVTGTIRVQDAGNVDVQTFLVNAGIALANPLQVSAKVESTTLAGGIATSVAGDVAIRSAAISLGNSVSTAATNSKVTLLGAVALSTDVTVSAVSGAITLAGAVDGGYRLTTNTKGTTTFAGPVGAVAALASLETAGGGSTAIRSRLVRTGGDQTFGGPVNLIPGGPVEPVTLAGTTIKTLSTLYGASLSLVIDGDAVLGGHPGSTFGDEPVDGHTGLGSLTITGATTINATRVSGSGAATYVGAVTLGSDVKLSPQGLSLESGVTGAGRILEAAMSYFKGDIVVAGDVGSALDPLREITFRTGDFIRFDGTLHATDSVLMLSDVGGIGGGASNAIRVPSGDVTLFARAGIGVSEPITVEAQHVFADSVGDIRLRAIGDLVAGGNPEAPTQQGIRADGNLDLQASGEIIVPSGLLIDAGGTVTTNKPILWQVGTASGAGRGTLGRVIAAANDTNVGGIIEFVGSTVFEITNPIPTVTTSLDINGSNAVTLDGRGVAANGLVFGAEATGSRLRGLTMQGFRNFAIRLEASPGVTISGMTITSMNTKSSMGLYATGDLTGTTIESSLFTGGLRGALLVDARNLAFGAIGRGNTFYNNRPVPGSQYSGTGIRAQGNCGGTVVSGNTFNWNNYGFAFINCRNLRLENNLFTRNRIAAIFVEGNNRGSSQAGNTFGTGPDRNAKIFRRIPGSSGI